MAEPIQILIFARVVAEGERIEAELLKAGLPYAARRVETEEVLRMAMAERVPDLILADDQPSSVGGKALLGIVRDTCPEVPLIFVAGAGAEEEVPDMLDLGASDYILKEQLSRLVPTVRGAVRGHQERSRRQQVERALQESEERYRAIVESATDAILTSNSHGTVVLWNSGAERIFGYAPEEMIGKSIDGLMPERFQKAHHEGMRRVASGGEARLIGTTIELTGTRKGGAEFPMELSLSSWRTGEGVFFTAVIRDISERKETEELLRSLSTRDELTGLYNRRGFLTLAPQYLKMADRNRMAALLLFADLDGLKTINDTLGHLAGDEALRGIGSILRRTFRASDILARLGGDEFGVLAMETPITSAEKVLARLREALHAYNASTSVPLSLSVGIARYDREHRCSLEELMARADAQMYEEKREKKIP